MNVRDTLKLEQVPVSDREAEEAAFAKWNTLAKPIGSLGRIETMIARMAGIQGTADVQAKPRRLIVACADNGVVNQGVAATPPDITAVMAEQIAGGKSAVALMAKWNDCDMKVYDIGMFRRGHCSALIDCHLMDGTNDFSVEPAMPETVAIEAIRLGIEAVKTAARDGIKLLATGEMGIGNTTTTAAVAAALLNVDASVMTGRGAGLTNEAYERKIGVVQKAIEDHQLSASDPLKILSSVGGLDIAMLAGVFIGAALYRIPVIIDGVISSVSALLAERLVPGVRYAYLASHMSSEPAASLILDALEMTPFIDAGMRLGEGTGAVALMPLIDMAIDLYQHLITFDDIGMVP